MLKETRNSLKEILKDVPGLKSVEDLADQLKPEKGFVKKMPAVLLPPISGEFEKTATGQIYNLSLNGQLFLFCASRKPSCLIEESETVLEAVLSKLIEDKRLTLENWQVTDTAENLAVYEINFKYKPVLYKG